MTKFVNELERIETVVCSLVKQIKSNRILLPGMLWG